MSVLQKLYQIQPRCMECGSAYQLEAHHRIFRSMSRELPSFLGRALTLFFESTGVQKEPWELNDIQNMVRLCHNCHTDLHNCVNDGYMMKKYRNSFTDEHTGANIYYRKVKSLR